MKLDHIVMKRHGQGRIITLVTKWQKRVKIRGL